MTKKFKTLPPKSVSVLGMKIKVKLVNNLMVENRPVYGYFSSEESTIAIMSNQSCEMIWRTFFHELTHALTYRNGLNFTGISYEMNEIVAETNASLIYEFITQYWGEWHD
jgi:Zn-dependent peptidase ImmA (M78 family)